MKVLILAGGLGTRLSEESMFRPKPMVEIGGMPILWHIMKIYSAQGFNEFVICAGYKQHVIKEWFSDYFLHTSDVTFDFARGDEVIVHSRHVEPWKVTVVDTGLKTMTGGRIKRVKKYVGDESFMLTYGDGVADVDLGELLRRHRELGKVGTVSVCNFGQNKGVLDIGEDGVVKSFREKSDLDGDLVNIGFMVMNPDVFELIEGDQTVFEEEPIASLVGAGELASYTHKGFWQCMDTLREKNKLDELWESGEAPWKIWRD